MSLVPYERCGKKGLACHRTPSVLNFAVVVLLKSINIIVL